jgi:hypothetical protein
MGFNKHSYQKIDPATINPDDYAQNMRGEQQHLGDVREYNSAHNERNPETDVRLEDMARPGTVFYTDLEGYEGHWMVAKMPRIRSPKSWAVVQKADAEGNVLDEDLVELRTDDLGLAVDDENLFKQTLTKITKKGQIGREQREMLTKR